MSLEMQSRSPRSKASSICADWACQALDATEPDSRTSSLPTLCDDAIKIVASKEHLQVSWDHLAKFNGQGPGPNGLKFRDFTRVAKLAEIDRLHAELTEGNYRHGGVRSVTVPKRPGSTGTRTLSLPNIQDRVVAHAIVQVLEPLFRNRLDPRSFCRFTLGPWHALSEAKQLAEKECRWVWITEDICDAFDSVSVARLFEILESYLPSEPLLNLLRRAVDDRRERKLYQGSPLSPLLMNILLDSVIDRPWRNLHPAVPLLRYMDDVAILCNDDDDVERLHSDLKELATREVLELKHGREKAVHDLQMSSPVWLGYSLNREQDTLTSQLPFLKSTAETMQWKKYLTARFVELHHKADARMAAVQLINGILAWAGPALPWSDPKAIYELLRACARAAGVEEIQSYTAAHRAWRESHDRWQKFLENPFPQPALLRPDVWLEDSEPNVVPF